MLRKLVIELGLNAKNDIILIGGKEDILIANELVRETNNKRIKSVCGKTTLRESIALIHLCSGAIAADSGLGHVAANLGLPRTNLAFELAQPRFPGMYGCPAIHVYGVIVIFVFISISI